MKNYLYAVLAVLATTFLLFTSCSTDDERYYVKYEVISSSTIQSIVCKSEGGLKYFSQEGTKWEITFGPYEKGDKVSISASNSGNDIQARIYISIEKEPFVLKAEKKEKGRVELEYTIDY